MKTEPASPASPLVSLTFTDVDGDKVVITTNGAGALTLGGRERQDRLDNIGGSLIGAAASQSGFIVAPTITQ